MTNTDNLIILIANDDPVIRYDLSKRLKQKQHRILEAHNYTICLQQLEQHQVDLIIYDHHLPGADAFELLTWINRTAIDSNVVVTGNIYDYQTLTELLKLGTLDCIENPLDEFSDLLQLIDNLETSTSHHYQHILKNLSSIKTQQATTNVAMYLTQPPVMPEPLSIRQINPNRQFFYDAFTIGERFKLVFLADWASQGEHTIYFSQVAKWLIKRRIETFKLPISYLLSHLEKELSEPLNLISSNSDFSYLLVDTVKGSLHCLWGKHSSITRQEFPLISTKPSSLQLIQGISHYISFCYEKPTQLELIWQT
ncbi:response regulator [Paraferrimonas sp. SM1919]|uniref:response regulator n=1 Tax=Paraferrimonas sp. SM1919 TaxID=2662263 RepID=UPI0013D054F2|nr:response regulator [Paraferrimonas sp. SM1919]